MTYAITIGLMLWLIIGSSIILVAIDLQPQIFNRRLYVVAAVLVVLLWPFMIMRLVVRSIFKGSNG